MTTHHQEVFSHIIDHVFAYVIGLQQAQVMPGAPPGTHVARGRPPKPVPVPLPDDTMQPAQQKSKVPVLEKHLVTQLSEEEQNSLNSKFQEATEANKKVHPGSPNLLIVYFSMSWDLRI